MSVVDSAHRPRGLCVAVVICCWLASGPARGEGLLVFDPSPDALVDAAEQLAAILEEQGVPTELRTPLPGDDPGDLGAYDCVWDVRVNAGLTPTEIARYQDYSMGGGSIVLIGENAGFSPRNLSIADLLNSLGAGGVFPDLTPPLVGGDADIPEAVNTEISLGRDCCPVAEVVYDGVANGSFQSLGNGVAITSDPPRVGAGLWDLGSLVGAPEAIVAAILDVNFLAAGDGGTLDFRVEDRSVPTENRTFVRNLVGFTCGTSCFADLRPPRGPRAPLSVASPASPRSPLVPCSPASPISPTSG